jgi:hypothetical protein
VDRLVAGRPSQQRPIPAQPAHSTTSPNTSFYPGSSPRAARQQHAGGIAAEHGARGSPIALCRNATTMEYRSSIAFSNQFAAKSISPQQVWKIAKPVRCSIGNARCEI